LPFFLLRQWLFVDRAVFSLDYLLLGLIAPYGSAYLACFLAIFWAIDILTISSKIYLFTTVIDFTKAIQFIELINFRDFLSTSVLVINLSFMLISFFIIRFTPRRISFISIISIGLAFTSLDYLNGSLGMFPRDIQHLSINISGSSLRAFVLQGLKSLDSGNQPMVQTLESERWLNITEANTWSQKYQDRSILFLIIESFGYHKDSEIRQWLKKQLIDESFQKKYSSTEFAAPFKGATTDSEFRQLCGLMGNYSNMTRQIGKSCIPEILRNAGWETFGFHGFSGRMFDRNIWWPSLGIQHSFFAEKLLTAGAPECGGTFRGACDAYVLIPISQILKKPKQFVYQLTLNTHLPITKTTIPNDLRAICERSHTADVPCQLIAAHGNYLRALREILNEIPLPPIVVLVGDHAPPLSRLRDRDLFEHNVVPAFLLIPK
jgi:hypothetical protein